ncbi:MAG: DUF378 domain-containing protein [Chlamydiales bacterium]|nr:DUF378 domain-containing protein [Chlamydiales bacterium]
MVKRCCVLCKIVGILLIIGALNWGLVGLLDFNLVTYLFGVGSVISHVVYIVVGLAGLVGLVGFFRGCRCCDKTCDYDEGGDGDKMP